MSKEVKEIRVPGFVGVLVLFAILFAGIFVFTKTMEWLTSVFSTPQLIFAFAMFVPAAFLLRYLSAGALVFDRDELKAMEGGLEIFVFIFFAVGFFTVSHFFMPDSIKEAYDQDGWLNVIVGTVMGVTMIACFKWFFKKLKVKSRLRGNLEGYRMPKSRK